MRVMIPASGGLDSTTLLWEVLTGTGHEVVAVHFDESWGASPSAERERAARSAFDEVAAWLRREARDFEARSGRVVTASAAGEPFPEAPAPIRPGFVQQDAPRWHYRIFASIGANATDTGADEAWVGLNTWNRRRDPAWAGIERAVFADYAPAAALRFPWLAERDGVWTGRSRLGNLRRIPAALHSLTTHCYVLGDGACGRCLSCLARAFHDTFCRDLDEAGLARVEERIEELASFGRHFATADPETYDHRIIDDVLRDEHGWREWFEAEGPAGG